MSEGRSTGTVSVRLPDEVIEAIKGKLGEGETVNSWLRNMVMQWAGTVVHTTKPVLPPTPVHTTVEATKASEAPTEAVQTTEDDPVMSLPKYEQAIHRKGDKVRIFSNGKWRATVVAYDVDLDGNPILE